MSKSLPARPNLEQLRNQAKDLLKQYLAGDPGAVDRAREFHPDFGGSSVKLPETLLTPFLSTLEGERLTKGRARRKVFRLHDAQFVIAREYGFASWLKLKEHVESILLETGDAMELFKKAFTEHDATRFRQLLERFPEYKAKINEPVAAFDAPLITRVRTREMLDVLLEAGADINAKSRWWAGGFGLLHGAEPDLAAYAIQRGAIVDVHAAARLGMIGKLRELISADPALVHVRGGDGQTPLHFASTVEIANFLLDHGAHIDVRDRSEEHTSELQSLRHLVCRLLLEKKNRSQPKAIRQAGLARCEELHRQRTHELA